MFVGTDIILQSATFIGHQRAATVTHRLYSNPSRRGQPGFPDRN